MQPSHVGASFNGPAQALLLALSSVPPALNDVYWSIIEEAPTHFGLGDIARLIVDDSQAACRRGEPVRAVKRVLEHRIDNFCLCLNDDDAHDFRRLMIAEMDAR